MHQTFSESLWCAGNCIGYRQRELQKDTPHDLHELTVRKIDKWIMTIHSVMDTMGEEHQRCYGKRTNFPCIVQARFCGSTGEKWLTQLGLADFLQKVSKLEKDICTCRFELGSGFSGLESQGLELYRLSRRAHLPPNGPDQALLTKHRASPGHQSTQYPPRNRKKLGLPREPSVRAWCT